MTPDMRLFVLWLKIHCSAVESHRKAVSDAVEYTGSSTPRVGPASGYGPAADRLEGWRWTMSAHARTTGGQELDVRLQADGHPGYLATARLLGEAGMLLAEDGATPARAGCLTPATALGTACIERFERAQVRFSVGA
jgi:short subunit dehydrogenase-like uncharacterized protein